jgi:hypothetical protein
VIAPKVPKTQDLANAAYADAGRGELETFGAVAHIATMAADPREPIFSSFDAPTEPSPVATYVLPLDQWNWAVRFVEHLDELEGKATLRAKVEHYLKAGGKVSRKQYPDIRADSPALAEAVVAKLYSAVVAANRPPQPHPDILKTVSRLAKAMTERLNIGRQPPEVSTFTTPTQRAVRLVGKLFVKPYAYLGI